MTPKNHSLCFDSCLLRHVSLFVCLGSLTACTSLDSGGKYSNTPPPTYNSSVPYGSTLLYPEGYESTSDRSNNLTELNETKTVSVPDTYLIGRDSTPMPHTDMDKTWVNSQDAAAYTIELANGDKASDVANTLYHAPKRERMAEIKYQRDGKTYYKGVYGTYPTREAAQQALKDLPEQVKQHADVKTWSTVQSP